MRSSVLMALAALLGFSTVPEIQETPTAASTREQALLATTLEAQADQPNGAVSPGTRFLVGLDDVISTKDAKAGGKFSVHTLEPLSTPDGWGLRAGVEIR